MAVERRVNADLPLLALLQRGARWFSDELTRRLASTGVGPITPAHATVLAHLHPNTSLSIAELARRAGVTRQTMHRAVTQLVNEGLLTGTPGSGFPRSTTIGLTDAGAQRSRAASGVLRDLERELDDQVGAERVEHLRAILAQIWPSTPT